MRKVNHGAPKAHVIASKYLSGPVSHPEQTAAVSQSWESFRALGTSATDLHAARIEQPQSASNKNTLFLFFGSGGQLETVQM